ncbi:MAG: UDP-N-acetylmuramate dehydrogenase [Myxococcales bacterium]|nr:UDP-N-acetylmuramate dehydrogenase [Myxococcales bacterium]
MLAPPRGLDVNRDVELAPRTTMGVGGRAQWLALVPDEAAALAAFQWAATCGMPTWVLGGGSNVVVDDAGLDGLVVVPAGQGRSVLARSGSETCLRVDAGCVWDDLVQWTVARGLQGLECLSGIPGLVGAAPIQNIGAYGAEVATRLESVRVLDRRTLVASALPHAACAFGYRTSALKQDPQRWLVLSVVLRLDQDAAPVAHYGQLRENLAHGGCDPDSLPSGVAGLQAVRAAVLALRQAKGMVIDAADPDSRSCGSFFENPVLAAETAATAVRALGHVPATPGVPWWPEPDGAHVKLSAAWLIQLSGMQCGDGVGPVGLSSKHTLAIVNRGGATAAQVLAFADHVVRRVVAACGVRLRREPVVLGTGSDGAPSEYIQT